MPRHKPPERVRMRPKVKRELNLFDARMRDAVVAIRTEKGRYLEGILDAIGVDTKKHNYVLAQDNSEVTLLKPGTKPSNVVELKRQRREKAS